jgi:hypothetical protein
MNIFLRALIIIIGGYVLFACSQGKDEAAADKSASQPPLFTLLTQAQSNISFSNDLSEGPNTNILMYEYFYNGGGVAAGDLNGDGLDDVYLVANMTDNKLYLNKGKLEFKDISALSGAAGRPGPWKTGVTFTDVNGDGKLDIYLCYSGALPDHKRVNQLFINEGNDAQGIPHFKDKAAEYGLATAAYSNQSYFFDYDRDGDLDMLLLNHNPKSLPILNEVSTAEFLKKDDVLMGTRLFQQTNGKFKDVTRQANISGSALSYGLGIGIADFNQDQWPDFYLSNDYNVPDYLYINQRDGTFKDQLRESIGHNSQFSMGNDVADVNNDGWPDIFTLDMLPEDNHRQKLLLAPDNYGKFELNLRTGFHYQYMRNMLQINNGNDTFSEVAQAAGISNTDWSWAALFADYNNDGWKDLLVTNGYLRDYTNLDFIKYMNDMVAAKGRLKREDVLEIVSHMPSSNVINYIFANHGGQQFSQTGKAWGFTKPSNSNGAIYSDLDNDGDLDLIINNINQPAFVYRNNRSEMEASHFLKVKLHGDGLNTQGLGAEVTVFTNGQSQVLYQSPSRGYLSSVSPVLHFGLGAITSVDSLVVKWNSGKKETVTHPATNAVIELFEKNAQQQTTKEKGLPAFFKEVKSSVEASVSLSEINDFNRQPLLPYQFSYTAPCLAKADVNGDGKEDIFVGGGYQQAASLFIQTADEKFVRKPIPDFEKDKTQVDADAIFFDADQDGDADLYVASGGYHQFQPGDDLLEDRLYMNDGKGNFALSRSSLPSMKFSKSCVRAADINQDGKPDLFVGGRLIPGRYPETPQSFILINDGKGSFTDQTESIAPALKAAGMITDALFTDINHDKQNDLITVGEWAPVTVWLNQDGKLVNSTSQFFGAAQHGFWNRIATADFNKDGKPDFVVGNYGLNTQCKVSDEQPAELYFKDFDNNGMVDPVFCFFIQGKSYPYLTRDELLEQQGRFRQRFNSYASYADRTVSQIFSEEELKSATRLTANQLATGIYLSKGDRYEFMPLPSEAQWAPVFSITVLDYDRDGKEDLLLCGNITKMKVRIGKMDANYGMLFKGDGAGNFSYIPQRFSGFKIQGDVRNVLAIHDKLLFSLIDHPLRMYKRLE